MINFKENMSMGDGVFVLRGNVKIYDGDRIILDKDNAITNTFRKLIMTKLFNDIFKHIDNAGINTVSATVASPANSDAYIKSIKFGRGASGSMGAKASKDDTKLVYPIGDKTVEEPPVPLYINTDIKRDLNILFNYEELRLQFTSELINNDTVTYVLGELGIFMSDNSMLTHLFFDPIYFEPNTTKKIVYTIYLY